MMSTADSGKYLTKKWHRDRARALVDRTRFTAAELEWLEVGDNEGLGRHDPETYRFRSTPTDPRTTPRKLDRRKLPWVAE